jgi:phosphatidylserine/phosphatidylglycerophosphate/cardiolipin synthase-like enzyme
MKISKLITLFAIFACGNFALRAQTFSVAAARALPAGSTVTVRGIVTNGPELGKIRYLQDGTAGIAAFPGAGSQAGFEAAVTRGDSIEVTGTLVVFHGLLEISPITNYTVISSGHPLPAPKTVALAELSDALESQLLEIECVAFANGGATFFGGSTYDLADPSGNAAKIYLRSGHPLQGATIPTEPAHLVAILSEYDDFQLLPRDLADFEAAPCFYFSDKLEQLEIATTSFKVTWATNLPATATIRIGTTPNPTNPLPLSGSNLQHAHLFTGLQPGTIYWVQVEAAHNGDVIYSETRPFATRSLSSGHIKTYFNHPIDPSSANGLLPDGQTTAEVLAETIARIDAAQQTLDVALYNNNRTDLTSALKAAHTRGVRVRYVAALDASNTALQPTPGFPVVYGNSSALMHNKFMVIDADLPDKAWVMGGSMNWTNVNVNNDFNNTLFIQDQSLARAYELEFEEMWGSDSAQPDLLAGRFGAAKKDNTPHRFIIGGRNVEAWFSPSDQVTSRIVEAVRSADADALFALFSFTKDEIGQAFVEEYFEGSDVRGIMENISDLGAEFNYLLSNGLEVQHHAASGDLHHKYAVVDATAPNSDPLVVTGSHNWSFSAETANDENTLVIHDHALATLFRAEFERRWSELSVATQAPEHQLFKILPNPASDFLELRELPDSEGIVLVKNTLGQVLFSEPLGGRGALRLNVVGCLPGQYFVTFIGPHGLATLPFQKI